MSNKNVREAKGKIASIIGIIFNIFLALGKIIVGFCFGFLSVLADGLNNLSDCGSSVVSLISFKLSSKPPDKQHPYGHERIEYISSMIVAFIILIIAFELAKESILKIINPISINFSYVVIITLLVSIIVKAGLFTYYRFLSKKINSDLLKATSIDCISDCISTTTVLISIIFYKLTNINIDGYVGIIVVIFIVFSGIGILRDTISNLIGQAPSDELIKSIKNRILSYTEVLGVHDLNVYSYGPNKYFVSVHIEIDANTDVMTSHEIIDKIEKDFKDNTNILLTGHHDPIVINDEEVNLMREQINALVLNINKDFFMHDFRMVKGPEITNLIFEVAIPFDSKIKEEKIIEILKEEISKINEKYNPVIMVEYQIL